jgi:hypothetical protein
MFHSSGLAPMDFLLVYALLAAGIFLLYHYWFSISESLPRMRSTSWSLASR